LRHGPHFISPKEFASQPFLNQARVSTIACSFQPFN
jgi:hypothetical protein